MTPVPRMAAPTQHLLCLPLYLEGRMQEHGPLAAENVFKSYWGNSSILHSSYASWRCFCLRSSPNSMLPLLAWEIMNVFFNTHQLQELVFLFVSVFNWCISHLTIEWYSSIFGSLKGPTQDDISNDDSARKRFDNTFKKAVTTRCMSSIFGLCIFLSSIRTAPSCLTDGRSRKMNYLKYFHGKLPGSVISGDEQCKEQYGKGVFQCKRALVRKQT